MALRSALPPSITHSRTRSASSPRSTRSRQQRATTRVASVEPSRSPSTCLLPLASMPRASRITRSRKWMPSIITTGRSSSLIEPDSHSCSCAWLSATQRRETALLDADSGWSAAGNLLQGAGIAARGYARGDRRQRRHVQRVAVRGPDEGGQCQLAVARTLRARGLAMPMRWPPSTTWIARCRRAPPGGRRRARSWRRTGPLGRLPSSRPAPACRRSRTDLERMLHVAQHTLRRSTTAAPAPPVLPAARASCETSFRWFLSLLARHLDVRIQAKGTATLSSLVQHVPGHRSFFSGLDAGRIRVSLTESDGTTLNRSLDSADGGGLGGVAFFGITDTSAFSSVALSYRAGSDNFGLDGIIFNNTLIPEPATVALVGSALLGVVATRRRKATISAV